MSKQVQKNHKKEKQQIGQEQQLEQILCDGCDKMYHQNIYIKHWQQCIQIKKDKQRREKLIKRKLQQEKKRQKQEKKKRKQAKKQKQQKKIKKQEEIIEKKQFITPQKQVMRQETSVIICKQCNTPFDSSASAKKDHEMICSQREVKCEYCEVMVVHYLINEHIQTCQIKKAIILSNLTSPMNSIPGRQNNSRTQQSNHSGYNPSPNAFNISPEPPQRQNNFHPNSPIQDPNVLAMLSSQYQLSQQQIQGLRNLGTVHVGQPNLLVNQRQEEVHPDSDLLQQFFQSFKPKEKFNEQQIKHFKKIYYEQKYKDTSCSICREEFMKKQELILLQCGHIFHPNCVSNWLLTAVTCPNCMKKLKGDK